MDLELVALHALMFPNLVTRDELARLDRAGYRRWSSPNSDDRIWTRAPILGEGPWTASRLVSGVD